MAGNNLTPMEVIKGRERDRYYENKRVISEVIEVLSSIKRDIEDNPFKTFSPNEGFQRAFLNSGSRFRVVFAGNRSGKSILSAYEVCRFSLGIHPIKKVEVPNIGWVVCPDMRLSSSIMFPYITKFLGNNIHRYYKREAILVLKNGSEIHFKSCDSGIQKFTGVSIKYAAIDEDCPEDVFREIFMRTIDQRGDLWFTITPLYSTWMYEKIWLRQYTDVELEIFVGSTYENVKHISLSEINRLKSIYSKEELEARLYGKFLFLSGLIYPNFNKKQHVITPFHIPDNWIRLRFVDSGINDPTCCLWVAVSPDNEYYVYREYYETGLTIPENVRNILNLNGKDRILYTWIDSTTDRRSSQTSITDYRAYINAGLSPLLKAPFVAVGTKIDKVRNILNTNRLKIFNTCMNTIREFSLWSFKKSGMPEDKNNHALDCIGYLCCIEPKYQNLGSKVPKLLPTNKDIL